MKYYIVLWLCLKKAQFYLLDPDPYIESGSGSKTQGIQESNRQTKVSNAFNFLGEGNRA